MARPYPSAARVQQETPLKQSLPRDKPVPRRFKPGCRGRSPRQSKLKISPFPTGEGGRGDRGQENQLKAVATGNKESTLPSRTPPAEQWQNKPTPQTNLRKTKKDAHAPSIQTFKLPNYQAIITKFISNRKEGREEEKKKLKRMKNRCTEEVQEVQALGQLVSVS